MAIRFPQRWTSQTSPEDTGGVLQNALDFLADIVDKFMSATTKGTVTIPNGATNVSVGFSSAITSPAVVVTPIGDPGARFWISGRTNSGFTINQGVAAPVAGQQYDWIAKGA